MMEMSIMLDKAKIEKESKLSYNEICGRIDEVFSKFHCIKTQEDPLRYAGNPKRGNFLNDFGCVMISLQDETWFKPFCQQWIWYDNDFDESQPYYEMDVFRELNKKKVR